MGTVTYPDPQVAGMLNERFIAVRLRVEDNQDLADRYQAVWTPALLCMDGEDRVHAKTFGFLPPAEFMAHLALWEGKYALDRGEFVRAERCFDEVATRWPDASCAPEALYWKGVSNYKKGDTHGLMGTWRKLKERYPESAWQIRSSFIFREK